MYLCIRTALVSLTCFPLCESVPDALDIDTKGLQTVFRVKVAILCFICTAKAFLWFDHLIHNVVCRKKQSINVAWNIKIKTF